jgi:hypothetical protein
MRRKGQQERMMRRRTVREAHVQTIQHTNNLSESRNRHKGSSSLRRMPLYFKLKKKRRKKTTCFLHGCKKAVQDDWKVVSFHSTRKCRHRRHHALHGTRSVLRRQLFEKKRSGRVLNMHSAHKTRSKLQNRKIQSVALLKNINKV